MGRWATRNRRGGGGASATLGLTISNVILNDATTYDVVFSGTATRVAGTPNTAFKVNGLVITATAQNGANTIRVTATGATADALPWTLTFQPNWVSQPVQFPQSGLTETS